MKFIIVFIICCCGSLDDAWVSIMRDWIHCVTPARIGKM
jgi:hypothetical protein